MSEGELVKALRCCDKYALCNDCPIFETCDGDVDKAMAIAADAIEALQAEVKRLKEANDELREAQTYIDHYGDKWLTSAKDVPTSAYNHGYMDGKNEAEQALEPKRGEWIYDGKFMELHKFRCSNCKRTEFRMSDYCPNCGADMRKMEAQE